MTSETTQKILIDRLSTDARGVGKLSDGKICFVENALPQEVHDVVITKQKKNYAEGKSQKILEAAATRSTPFCPHYLVCGGCQLQHLNESEHLEQKKKFFLETMRRVGNQELPVLEWLEKNTRITGLQNRDYRRRIKLAVRDGKIGFQEKERHQIVELVSCGIAHPACVRWMKAARDVLRKQKIKESFAVEVFVHGKNEEKCNFWIEPLSKDFPLSPKQKEKLEKIFEEISSPSQEFYEIDFGAEIPFLFASRNFIQPHVHAPMAYHKYLDDVLPKYVHQKNKIHFLDLYCGAGFFSLAIQQIFKKHFPHIALSISAVENNPHVKKSVHKNVPEAQFFNVTTEKFCTQLKPQDIPDIILVDPPRSGIDKDALLKLLQTIQASKKKILLIYVSCDVASFARDAKLISQNSDLQMREVCLFDAFAFTHHMETVCLFIPNL